MTSDSLPQRLSTVPRIGYRCPNCNTLQHDKTLHWACIEPIRLKDGATTPQWFVCEQVVNIDCPSCGALADWPCRDAAGEPQRSCHEDRHA